MLKQRANVNTPLMLSHRESEIPCGESLDREKEKKKANHPETIKTAHGAPEGWKITKPDDSQ